MEAGFGLTVSGRSALRVENYYVAAPWCWCCSCCCATLSIPASAARCRHPRPRDCRRRDGHQHRRLQTARLRVECAARGNGRVFFTHYTGGIGPSEASAFKSVRYVALAASAAWQASGRHRHEHPVELLSLRGLFGSYDNAVFGVILITIVSLAPEGPLKRSGCGRAAGRDAFHRVQTKQKNGDTVERVPTTVI